MILCKWVVVSETKRSCGNRHVNSGRSRLCVRPCHGIGRTALCLSVPMCLHPTFSHPAGHMITIISSLPQNYETRYRITSSCIPWFGANSCSLPLHVWDYFWLQSQETHVGLWMCNRWFAFVQGSVEINLDLPCLYWLACLTRSSIS